MTRAPTATRVIDPQSLGGTDMQANFSQYAFAALVAASGSYARSSVGMFQTVPVPGPIAGAGLPALVIAGAALWLVRKYGRRRQRDFEFPAPSGASRKHSRQDRRIGFPRPHRRKRGEHTRLRTVEMGNRPAIFCGQGR